jgi:hypothetical protein
MLDTKFKKLKASSVACAVVYDVRASLSISPIWRYELKQLTQVNDPTDESNEVGQVLKLIHDSEYESKMASLSSNSESGSIGSQMCDEGDGVQHTNNPSTPNGHSSSFASSCTSSFSSTNASASSISKNNCMSPTGKENVPSSVPAIPAPVTPDAKTVLGDSSKIEYQASPTSVVDDNIQSCMNPSSFKVILPVPSSSSSSSSQSTSTSTSISTTSTSTR